MDVSTGIPSNEFSNNSNILSVFFSSNCKFIGSNAFEKCINLKEINDNNVIEEIGSSAFASCSNLSEITFNKLSTLHEGAFESCSNLKYTIISNCTSIPKNAFLNCSSLSIIDLINIKEIGSNAFMNCTNLTNVILSSCTNIYPSAFSGCSSLSKVVIYNDYNTFCRLESSTSFDISQNTLFYFKANTIESYKNDSNWSHFSSKMRILPGKKQIIYKTSNNEKASISQYYGGVIEHELIDNDMISITYEDEINSILTYTFKLGNQRINEILLPDGCTEIENYAFAEIEDDKFDGFKNLYNITLSDTLTTIGEYAFYNCINLRNINLPNKLTTIGKYAFKNCEYISTINIPQSIESLGEGIFAGCTNLVQISGKFVYKNVAIVYNNTLIFVIPKVITIGFELRNDRIYNISDIDKNITRLGEYCFYGCDYIGRVNIPSNIESIGDYCFYDSNIREIHFEGDIPPKFGKNICENISDVKIFVPEKSLFEYCNALESSGNDITNVYPKPENDCIIYYSNNKINSLNNQEYINKGCTNGEYYRISNINNGILPTNYFNKQSEVTTVILSDNIIEISKKAFEECLKLEYIYLPETLTTLGESCFCKCTNMEEVNIPSNVKKPKNNIFEECTALSYINSYNKEYISTNDNRCFTHSGEIISFAPGIFKKDKYHIPNNITSIGDKAFYKCTDTKTESSLKEIVMDSIETIGDNAFGESSLESIKFSSQNLKSIGDKAFYNCTNLMKITFDNIYNNSPSLTPDSLDLETIGVSAFENCKNMVIKSDKDFGNIITINENAFKNCTNFEFKKLNDEITNLNLTKVSSINNCAFYNCTKLTKITLNDNITTIGEKAFYYCTKLKKLNLPNKLTTIGKSAFYNCKNLNNLKLPDTLTTIGDFAFNKCENFKGYNYNNTNNNSPDVDITRNYEELPANYILKIPKNVTSIGYNSFGYTSIQKIEIYDSKLTKIPDYAFSYCTKLKTIDIQSPNITYIGKHAFYSCEELCENISNTNQLILNNIEVVDDFAFYNCNKITYITFSSKLMSLGNLCLQNNNTSMQVVVYKTTPPIFTKNIINDTNSTPFSTENIPNIKVPRNSIIAYQRNIYWKKYSENISSTSIIS